MKRSSQITLLLTILAVGFAVQTATADEPSDKPPPKLIQAKQPQIQAVKQQRTFSGLLQKGQTVTLSQFGQEALYQVRIVNEDQKKQIEDVLESIRKESEEYESKKASLVKQIQEVTEIIRPIRNPAMDEQRSKQTELNKTLTELRQTYRPRRLPSDFTLGKFYTIRDVGSDYVGFERNGVETFHRLSSIHRIIRGVEIVEE